MVKASRCFLLVFCIIAIMSSTTSAYRLAGKVICLSGASSGIGAAIAEALYQEGAKVCIGARRVERLDVVAKQCQEKFPDSPAKIITAQLDVTDRTSVQSMIGKALQEFGGDAVDAMVCCAGVMYFTKMKNAVMDEWDQVCKDLNEYTRLSILSPNLTLSLFSIKTILSDN